MKIKDISSTPLFVPYLQPYYWSQGITAGSEVLLIEIKTDQGQVGFGECLATPTAVGVKAFVDEASRHLLGESIFDRERLMAICCLEERFGAMKFLR